jgi:phosphatidylserine decarboxylase
MIARDLGTALQLLLPHRLLSALIRLATHWRFGPWKRLLIAIFRRAYRIDLSEAADPDPDSYPSFNAFFTRALKPTARPVDTDPTALASPADGTISQIGRLREGRIVQAKGMDYALAELLGSETEAARFAGGGFATIYLSPRDYHRVHVPLAGRLTHTIHVPGRLFSVAPWTVESIPRLFARNERLAMFFETDQGPLAVVMVGAIFVSSIETVFDGMVTPPYGRRIVRRELPIAREFGKGYELARFNMGSTVILITSSGHPNWDPALRESVPVRMGQRMTVAAGA